VTIRSADPHSDAKTCAAIYAAYVESSPVSFEEVPPDAAEIAARMERIVATHPWLVAERNGEVIGYAYACPHREKAAYRWAVDVSVYVAAAQHRHGWGRALYGELLGRLRKQGVQVACAGITLPNEASVSLHESLGFAPVGVYRRIGWKAGAWRDVGWWQLELEPASEGPPAEPLPPELEPRLPLADG
jgi:L-amino acid N-acyltransferase YncA